MTEPRVAVVVPRRSHEWRDRVWKYLRARWETLPWPIIEGSDESSRPFNRSRCINEAAAEAGDFDALIVIDSDVYLPHQQVYDATEEALRSGRMVVAFDERYALSGPATRQILDEHVRTRMWRFLPLEVRCPYPGRWHRERGYRYGEPCMVSHHHSNSHCVVFPRELWERIGGMDERFEGWGFEDMATLASVRTFVGEPTRIEGYAIHFWHPRAAEREWTHSNYGVNEAYGNLYFAAEGNPEAIQALIDGRARATVRPLNPYDRLSLDEARQKFGEFAEEPAFETDDWFAYHHLRAVIERLKQR